MSKETRDIHLKVRDGDEVLVLSGTQRELLLQILYQPLGDWFDLPMEEVEVERLDLVRKLHLTAKFPHGYSPNYL